MSQSKSDKKFLRSSAAWALLAGLAASPSALAQTTDQPPATPAEEAAQPAEEEDAIVVTGSRLRQTEFTSAAPIQIISTERAELAGVADVAEMLQTSTLASGSLQNDATISSAFVTEGGPGSQTISLRGLGANRTLVLVNGRRGGPAGTRGQVSAFDLNVLPLSVIERFEILKDGASSVYGSDAVAGVVNIITRRDLDGGELEFSTSQPFETGGAQFGAEGVWGKTWDRGYFTASFDYYLQEELKVGAREYTRCREDYTFSQNGQRDDRIDARTGLPTCRDILSGQVWLYEYSDTGAFAPGQPFNSPGAQILIQYDPGGEIGVLLPQTILPPSVDGSNPTAPSDFAFINQIDRNTVGVTNANPPQLLESSLIPEIERHTAFFQAGYDLTSSTEAYAEVLLNKRRSRSNGVRQFWTYLLTYDYFYLDGSSGGDPFSAGWNGAATLSPTPVTDHFDAEQTVDYARVVAGLRGEFGGPLGAIAWDIFVQGSRSDAEYTQDVILDDAVDSANLRNVFGINFGLNSIDRPGASCVGFNTPISNRPCVDVNWLSGDFLNGNPTPEEAAFLFDRETGTTLYEQIYAEGSLSGDIFTLPAGNVGAVVGFHVRRDEIEDVPGHVTLAGNSWGLTSAGITAGEDSTSEAFGEVRLPIFRGQPLAEDVTLNLSGRYTDVESYGSDSTYKLGLNWQVSPEFRVRATTGTSFRAPALFEQFLADQTSFAGQRAIDPCINWGANLAAGNITQRIADNCAADGIPNNHGGAGASALIITGGGELEAETSDAWTVGVIWRPDFADLNIALDYFEIEINDEVRQLGAINILFGCYNSTQFAVEPLCDLFTRGQQSNAFLINTVTDRYINVATQVNRGLDLTIGYGHDFSWGDLTVDGQFTYQLEDAISLVEGIGEDNNGEVGDPYFTGIVDLRLDRDDWTYAWRAEFIGPTEDDIPDTNTAGTRLFKIGTEFTSYHSASIRYRYDQAELMFGVSNIFDERPPALSIGGSATQGNSALSSQYDYIGRRAFVRLRLMKN